MAFKLRSSGLPFKEMGSSPAKHTEDPHTPHRKNTSFEGNIMTNTDTGDTYNLKTGETIKNKKPKGPPKSPPKKPAPTKQAIGGGAGEAIEHHKKYKASKANTATGGDPKLEKLKAKRIANTKAGKIIKFGEGSNIIADKGPIDPWSSEVKKAKKVVKKGAKVAKKVAGKVAKFAGNKALGVLGFMGAGTLSATAGNKNAKKSEGEQIRNLLTKHNLKGGKN